jgi:antitoxin component of RelBE/YafQ-DinJ toxin-antitoxin module
MITTAKTEEIKVRVDPLSKSALIQIATEEQLDLSDIVRRALNDMIRKSQNPSRRQASSTNSRYVR